MYEEDKIFGPLTFKQFLFLAIGIGFCYFVYSKIETKFAYPLISLIGACALVLVFKFAPKKIEINRLEEYLKSKVNMNFDDFAKNFMAGKINISLDIILEKCALHKPVTKRNSARHPTITLVD